MTLEQNQLRSLPSVNDLLSTSQGQSLILASSHEMAVAVLRAALAQARADIRAGTHGPTKESLLLTAEILLQQRQQPRLRPVINATGVIVNTNLGRAPLSTEALLAVQQVASGYSNLEYALEPGGRGSRNAHITDLLRELTGAEAALVTNNNAAAVLLGLSALAQGREVIISRGQLVEIGGGFRVPDVMLQSGCQLVEVGTTNRTRIADYTAAISERTAVLLAVHPSNFLITGFTESTSLKELATLAHQHNLLVMEDLGSGCLLDCSRYGLAHEPTPQESIAAGADLVCFSGDKLLGGPQAGIIVGRQEIIARLAKHPLMRAVRIDKMTLAALETTLRHYLRNEAETHIPVWRMISYTSEQLARRVSGWATQLREQGITTHLQSGESTIGGGSLPDETLPTTLLALAESDLAALGRAKGHRYTSLAEIATRLRQWPTPVIPRISRDMLLLDPRTVLVEQDQELIRALKECIFA